MVGGDQSPLGPPMRVVLHNSSDWCGEDCGEGGGRPGSAARPQHLGAEAPPPAPSWGDNSLFDCMKGLYQQGAQDALQAGEHERWGGGGVGLSMG